MEKTEAIETLRFHSVEYEEIGEALNTLLNEIDKERKHNSILDKRIRHLFQSSTIRMYDDKVNGKYVKDIKSLDYIFNQKIVPQFIINADNKTTLVFESDLTLNHKYDKEILEYLEHKTGCKCLITSQTFRLKHVIQERNDQLCKEK